MASFVWWVVALRTTARLDSFVLVESEVELARSGEPRGFPSGVATPDMFKGTKVIQESPLEVDSNVGEI